MDDLQLDPDSLEVGRKPSEAPPCASFVEPSGEPPPKSKVEGKTPALPLMSGKVCRGHVAQFAYQYYKVVVPTKSMTLNVTVEALSGDPDIFVCNRNTNPNQKHHTWSSAGMGSDEVYLEPGDANFYPGAFYIGIYGAYDTEYNVLAEIERQEVVVRHPTPVGVRDGMSAMKSEISAADARRRSVKWGSAFLQELKRPRSPRTSTPRGAPATAASASVAPLQAADERKVGGAGEAKPDVGAEAPAPATPAGLGCEVSALPASPRRPRFGAAPSSPRARPPSPRATLNSPRASPPSPRASWPRPVPHPVQAPAAACDGSAAGACSLSVGSPGRDKSEERCDSPRSTITMSTLALAGGAVLPRAAEELPGPAEPGRLVPPSCSSPSPRVAEEEAATRLADVCFEQTASPRTGSSALLVSASSKNQLLEDTVVASTPRRLGGAAAAESPPDSPRESPRDTFDEAERRRLAELIRPQQPPVVERKPGERPSLDVGSL